MTSALPFAGGSRLGAYEIRGLIGAGGMGEVYRAFDTTLRRDVAVKVLPPAFTGDPERLARFEREARVLASLNHPHVAAIYGVEHVTTPTGVSVRALVLELIEGETLADRLARGALPVQDACRVAIQIALALEASHDKGVVHRDLKPANIKITPDGIVKVLDFGLAANAPAADADVTHATTLSAPTAPGMVLGTIPYMSPEQARGQTVDKRTDIWAFGCVLFEMITGRRAFEGETTSDVLARILEREPDWVRLPPATPATIRRLLRRALTRDPKDRLRDIADARFELQEIGSDAASGLSPSRPARSRTTVIAAALVALIAGGAIGGAVVPLLRRTPPAASSPARRFTIAVGPVETNARSVAISPDGRFVAYIAGAVGVQKAYLRSLVDNQVQTLAELPIDAGMFFSPDSQWIGYFDADLLKKRSVHGGSPAVLANASSGRGGTWSDDGTLVFAPVARSGLRILRPGAAAPEVLTTPDSARGETSHRFPKFVPHSRTVLFIAEGDTYASRAIESVSIDTKDVRVIQAGNAVSPAVAPSGHLTYRDGDRLVAAPFDSSTTKITGPAVTLVDDMRSYGFSNDGTLVYSRVDQAEARSSTLVWIGRNGTTTPLPLPAGSYEYPRLSPDGRRIIVHRQTGTDRSLWMYDIARDAMTRFTFGFSNSWPLWTPDGLHVLYGSNRAATRWDVYRKRADGGAAEEALVAGPDTEVPRAISSQGVLLHDVERDAGAPLYAMPLQTGAESRMLFPNGRGEVMPSFSPDGRWLAYVSTESGKREVYVSRSDGSGSKWQISNGGTEPLWAASGRELFFRDGDAMYAVDVTPSNESLSFGKPRALFTGTFGFGSTESQQYDVTRDGTRFLMLKPEHPGVPEPLNVIANWFDEIRAKASDAKP